MLVTTIYNQGNACITGTYYDAKGNKIDVEYMGSALECECYMNGVRQDNEGTNEVQHVVVYDKAPSFVTPVSTEFTLHNAWRSVVTV